MTNNQTRCGITSEKIAMRAGDDHERMINYEWPKTNKKYCALYLISHLLNVPSFLQEI